MGLYGYVFWQGFLARAFLSRVFIAGEFRNKLIADM